MIKFFKRKEGETCAIGAINFYIDDTQVTRLGLGFCFKLPFVSSLRVPFDSNNQDLKKHYYYLRLAMRWRAKHILGKRVYFSASTWWQE